MNNPSGTTANIILPGADYPFGSSAFGVTINSDSDFGTCTLTAVPTGNFTLGHSVSSVTAGFQKDDVNSSPGGQAYTNTSAVQEEFKNEFSEFALTGDELTAAMTAYTKISQGHTPMIWLCQSHTSLIDFCDRYGWRYTAVDPTNGCGCTYA